MAAELTSARQRLEQVAKGADPMKVYGPEWSLEGPSVDMREDLRSLLQAAPAPSGWKWTPREPTEEMMVEADYKRPLPDTYLAEAWRAMWDASPSPQAAPSGWRPGRNQVARLVLRVDHSPATVEAFEEGGHPKWTAALFAADRILALGEVQAEPSGWRPIESAPKIAGSLILAPNRYGVVAVVGWDDVCGCWDDGFRDEDGHLEPYDPKIWQPVPALPPARGQAPEPEVSGWRPTREQITRVISDKVRSRHDQDSVGRWYFWTEGQEEAADAILALSPEPSAEPDEGALERAAERLRALITEKSKRRSYFPTIQSCRAWVKELGSAISTLKEPKHG
jgi:hypothetical protein